HSQRPGRSLALPRRGASPSLRLASIVPKNTATGIAFRLGLSRRVVSCVTDKRGARPCRAPRQHAHLEVDSEIKVRGNELGLGDRDVRIVADLGDGQRLGADDADQRRTAGDNAVLGYAEQVTAPVADVRAGLADRFERNRGAETLASIGAAEALALC